MRRSNIVQFVCCCALTFGVLVHSIAGAQVAQHQEQAQAAQQEQAQALLATLPEQQRAVVQVIVAAMQGMLEDTELALTQRQLQRTLRCH